MFGQPDHQWLIIGNPAQQGHGSMGMGIDETGYQGMGGERLLDRFGILYAGLVGRQYVDDPPARHGNGMMVEDRAVGLYRDDPAGSE
jgi:hypothetical protein